MPEAEKYVLYHYKPSLALAAIGVIAFAVGTLVHGILAYRHKMKFLLAFIIGAVCESLRFSLEAFFGCHMNSCLLICICNR